MQAAALATGVEEVLDPPTVRRENAGEKGGLARRFQVESDEGLDVMMHMVLYLHHSVVEAPPPPPPPPACRGVNERPL